MRLDIQKIENEWVTVVEASDEKRYKNLFLRQLYAVERFLAFQPIEVSRVEYAHDVVFLVIRTKEHVRNKSDA